MGQGGEEYTNVSDLVLDEKRQEIYVNNLAAGKILVYDLSGNFKRSFKQKKDFFYNQMGDFNEDYLICHDGLLEFDKPDMKRNCCLLVSKLDGQIKEIEIPYEKKLSTLMMLRENGEIISNVYSIYNKHLVPNQGGWILVEPSADTIYTYSQEYQLSPFIVRTPSVQSMEPEIFLFPGVITERYCFFQTVKKEFDFVKETGFPKRDLVYDKQEDAIYECAVYNDDFVDKKQMSLVYEIPIPPVVTNNKGIAFITRLDAYELVELYKKGGLKGQLKQIASTLDEESNSVVMLGKYKKPD